jgi:phage terminase large subunit
VKIDAQFPEKLEFLFEPSRYKVAYGGRGAAKSWAFARAILILGTKRKLRVLCARETQKSLADSVHKLLSDQIHALGLSDHYHAGKAAIIGRNGTEIFFAGLKHNIQNIKSVEACDVVWVEEAQNTSLESWTTLIPTIRKDGSEIWVSFNPELETDDTYKRFVINPPPNARVQLVNWYDNPWFPEVLRIEMEHMRATDPRAYEHVWLGACRSALEGAVFAEEIKQAEAEGRITTVSYDRTRPVDTFWDLGFGDATAVWLAQATSSGFYHVIDYVENHGKTIEWYLIQLQQKGYLYGTDWIPWDGLKPQRLGSGRAIEELMRTAGRRVRMVNMLAVHERINAARTIFPSCRFDQTKCADGLQGLRHYQWGPPASSGALRREPLHDWASHPADAFTYLAVALRQPREAPAGRRSTPSTPSSEYAWMG